VRQPVRPRSLCPTPSRSTGVPAAPSSARSPAQRIATCPILPAAALGGTIPVSVLIDLSVCRQARSWRHCCPLWPAGIRTSPVWCAARNAANVSDQRMKRRCRPCRRSPPRPGPQPRYAGPRPSPCRRSTQAPLPQFGPAAPPGPHHAHSAKAIPSLPFQSGCSGTAGGSYAREDCTKNPWLLGAKFSLLDGGS
jgi:hypothetical protein